MQTPNIGEKGIESIRIDGMRIDELPMVAAAHAKQQLPLALETARQNRVNDIKSRYPTQNCGYLIGRINEARNNIDRMRGQIRKTRASIKEYYVQIRECRGKPTLRDLEPQFAEIAASDLTTSEKKEKIHQLRSQPLAPYDVEAMLQQIEQFDEYIEKLTDVIATEHESIAEMTGVLALCEQRDRELKSIAAG